MTTDPRLRPLRHTISLPVLRRGALRILAAFVLAAIGLTPACGGDGEKKEEVAARVDGQVITVAELESALEVMKVEGDSLTREEALDVLIDDLLVEREARRLGVVADEGVVDERIAAAEETVGGAGMLDHLLSESDVSRERFRERARSIVLREAFQKVRFPEAGAGVADARLYYRSHLGLFREPAAVKLGVIQAKTAGPIRASLEEIRRGASFAAAARRHSTDELARQNGGQQGWVSPASLPPGLKQVVAGLRPGEVSDAVNAWPGWYLVKVYGRRVARTRAFAEVRNDIVAELTRRRRAKALLEWLDAARAQSKIVIEP